MRPMPIHGALPRATMKSENMHARWRRSPARYGAGLEIGCSIGVMTRHLAQRCETLLAVDIAEAPLMAARRRCAGMPSCVLTG